MGWLWGPVLPLAPLPCTTSSGMHSSPAPGRPSSQRDFGSSSELSKPLSEPRCACTASWLDLCASEILFQSLYNTQWSTRSEHLQPLREEKRMTATSVIPSRGETAFPRLFFFFFLLFYIDNYSAEHYLDLPPQLLLSCSVVQPNCILEVTFLLTAA